MDYKKIVKEGYNAVAGRYLEGRSRDSEDVQLLDDFTQRLPAGATVLDAGCGAGVPVTLLLSKGFRVTGVDFSEAQIALARRHVPDAAFLCEDMTGLDLPAESFDGICSYYAIIHLPRDEHAPLLSNFQRMLKPGGFALLCLGAGHLIDDIEEDYLGAPMYWSHFDSETYLNVLEDLKFSIIWSRLVADATCEGAAHLFVLAEKPAR